MPAHDKGADQRIEIRHEADIIQARKEGRDLAAQLGFGIADQALIATAISEVARNILDYASQGEIRLGLVQNGGGPGISVSAADRGPGIANVEAALEDGYSTGGGLGLGLPGARRLMDEFSIESELGKGTHVQMTKWLRA